MKFNNFLVIVIIFLLTITPIASSNEYTPENNESSSIENSSIESDGNISALNPEPSQESSEIALEEQKNEFNEAILPVEGKSVNIKQYLPTLDTKEKYEIKKLGNREYEYVRNTDGKKFNSLDDIKKDIKSNEQVKLREGFEERLNLSNEKVRILVSLKIDPIEVQKEIQNIKEEYKDEEDKFKEEIRDISLKYAPKTKKQAIEIAETKEIIKISEEDLDKIKDKGKELEQVREQEVRAIKSKLSAKTEKVQNDFLDWVERNDGEIKRELDGLVSIEIPIEMLENVLDRSEVVFVELDEKLAKPELDVSTPTLLPVDWWNAGYNGFWTDTAVLDTGIDETHPALETDAEGVSRAFISQDFTSSGTTDDTEGHGTHVAGIIASSDSTYEGIAPGIDQLINAKHLGGVTSDTLAALDWAITNPNDGAEILSNSWGAKYKDSQDNCALNEDVNIDGDTYYATKYIDAATDYYDVIAVKSAGNDGKCGDTSLSAPGDSYNAIVVGAIDDKSTTNRADDMVADLSSRGPTLDGRKKPDIVAPGGDCNFIGNDCISYVNPIQSAAHDWEENFGLNPNFVGFSGTSMAAPHVSGAANLLLEYGLSSKGVKSLLINTAEDKGSSGWDAYYGWGEVDLNDAYTYRDYVIDDTVTEGSYKYYKVQIILVGEKATLVWNKHNTYAGASTPTTLYDINDLDLRLYRESDGSLKDSSIAIKDNVEQIESPEEFLDGVVKVEAYTTDFSHGLNTEDYSLATFGGYTSANGPSLTATENVPANGDDSGFTITCSVENTGDLYAHNVEATLVLPAGLSVTSGANPQALGTIMDGITDVATWTVSGDLGTHDNIYCTYDSDSYGELDNGLSTTSSVIITDDDEDPPVINSVNYPTTEKTYNTINIQINTTDTSGINAAIIHYDYGDDGKEDGATIMTNFGGDILSGDIPACGNPYKNKDSSFYIEIIDNDNDRVNDGTSINSQDYIIFIENTAPTIDSFTPLSLTPTVDEGTNLEFTPVLSDLDGDTLIYSWLLDSIQQATTQPWTYSPDYYSAGEHNITLIVSDGLLEDSQEWTVTVNNINQPLVWDPQPQNQTINEEETLMYDINATDPDGDTITYFVNDPEFNIDSEGLLTWTPIEDWFGTKDITLTASDGTDNITADISINIININDSPFMGVIDPISVNENDLVTITINAGDPDNDPLTYSIDDSNFIQDEINKYKFTWQTDYFDAGTYTPTVTVDDGNSGIITQDIALKVNNVLRTETLCNEVYDDFSEETLNLTKWEEYDASKPVDEHNLDTENQNYHTAQLIPSDKGIELKMLQQLQAGNIIEFDQIYSEGSGNHWGCTFWDEQADWSLNNYITCLGHWNEIDAYSNQYGIYHYQASYGDNYVDIIRTLPNGTIQSWRGFEGAIIPPYGFSVHSRTGHDGTLHFDYDNVNFCHINYEPEIISFSPLASDPIVIDETASVSFTDIKVTDQNDDTLTYSWLLDGVEKSIELTWKYETDYESAGNHVVTLKVSDGSLETSQDWNIIVNDKAPPSGGGSGGGGGGGGGGGSSEPQVAPQPAWNPPKIDIPMPKEEINKPKGETKSEEKEQTQSFFSKLWNWLKGAPSTTGQAITHPTKTKRNLGITIGAIAVIFILVFTVLYFLTGFNILRKFRRIRRKFKKSL